MLRPSLFSVFNQTYPNIEIIFIDNNSTDGSLRRAQEMSASSPYPIVLTVCPEQGDTNARNHGHRLAKGDFIQWHDADDELAADKIARQVTALESNPQADIAYGDWAGQNQIDGSAPELQPGEMNTMRDRILWAMGGHAPPPFVHLLRRSAADLLQQEQAWRPGRPVASGFEYFSLAALLGLRFMHVPGPSGVYNIWSPFQLSGTKKPYSLRVAALEQIFARFREVARRPEVARRITERHLVLLNQDWRVWEMPAGSVEITPEGRRRWRLHHRRSGRTIEVKSREAAVAEAMQEIGSRRAIAHHARQIARHVPHFANDPAFIIATLEKFRREGFLREADGD